MKKKSAFFSKKNKKKERNKNNEKRERERGVSFFLLDRLRVKRLLACAIERMVLALVC
jgi:hypothetical protein